MKKEMFLGMDCIGFGFPQGAFSENELGLWEYTGKKADLCKMNADGTMVIQTEEEWAINALVTGRGLIYKGYVYFLEEKLEGNAFYVQFEKAIKEFVNQLTKAEAFLYEGLFDTYHFYMVKNMITLYSKEIFTHEQITAKLELYLPKAKAVALLNYVKPSRVAV